MAGEDTEYTKWIRKQPCAKCGGIPPSECHHHTEGANAPEHDRGRKQLSGKRGLGQRAHDHESMPLCWKCHKGIQSFTGPFEGLTKAERAQWQDQQVRHYRELYAEELAALPAREEAQRERVARAQDAGPFLPEGVPCDPVAYGARFSAFYQHTEEQAHHLVRLLKRVAKESRRS